MELYRAGLHQRLAERRKWEEKRRQRALAVAQRAAKLLKREFGATHVVLFGSLARGGPFDEHSDIDLAAWGIEEDRYLRAISKLLDLDPTFSVDLVRAEEAPPSLLEVIESEGRDI